MAVHSMKIRKRMIAMTATVAVVAAVGLGTAVGVVYVDAKHTNVGEITFDEPLPVPPLAKSTVVNGTRVFNVDLKRGQANLGKGLSQPSYYGQDGSVGAATNDNAYLAPTLRAARGERVQVNVTNGLGTASTIHWHGMHLPASMDGGPHQMINPGVTWQPRWTVKQPAATLWYHPHLHGATGQQVQKGLAGLFLLDDPETPSAAALPHTYGVDDVPVVLQDKTFNREGSADTSPPQAPIAQTGYLGDTVLANGKVGATFTATTELLRLRLVNASLARVYNLGFSDDQEFSVVAGDGGLLEKAVTTRRVVMSPGDRLEVIVRVTPGATTMLRDYPVDLGSSLIGRLSGGDDTLDVLQLRGAQTLSSSTPLPAQLTTLPALDSHPVVRTREFNLEAPTINGKTMNMERIDATVTMGTTELWRVRNRDFMPHNFHIHDTQVRVKSLNGAAPPLEMQGRQDTIFLKPGDSVDLLVRFEDYTDPNTPYMFHCHFLWHEDRGMMGQFVVVRPGEKAGTVSAHRRAPSSTTAQSTMRDMDMSP